MIDRERALMHALHMAFRRERRDCSAFPDFRAGVAIQRAGHFRGLWRTAGEGFAFVPGGYGEPTITVAGIAEAVSHTLETVCRD